MREIVLDTETTGFEPESGHRIVEIGCLELINHVPTGKVFHKYVNPERDVPLGAFEVHGLSAEFLAKHPVFAEIAGDFLDFIQDAPLVIHNAAFDMKFLNAELGRLDLPVLPMDRAIDTLAIARDKFPGAGASLDALCKRFAIDNSNRTKHGALLDAELLAEVYLELCGGRQPNLGLDASTDGPGADSGGPVGSFDPIGGMARAPRRAPRPHRPTPEEEAAHQAFISGMKDPLWTRGEA